MTDGPDDILRGMLEGDGDPGPEATPEQEAFVSGLLGSLRRDDPPMPDDVIRRLDAVLAEERRRSGGGPVLGVIPGGAGADGSADTAGAAPASLPDNVSVLPAAGERRGPSMRSFRVLGGLAAAAVVVVGGVTILNNGGLSGGSTTSGGSGVAAPASASIVQDTGTAYSANALESQVQPLVAAADKGTSSDGGEALPEATASAQSSQGYETPDSAPAPTETGTDVSGSSAPSLTRSFPASAEPLTAERALLCTKEISDGTVSEPLLVDQGTFNGQPAEVYVLASVDEPGAYDVIVVAAGCTTGQSQLLTFRRIAAP